MHWSDLIMKSRVLDGVASLKIALAVFILGASTAISEYRITCLPRKCYSVARYRVASRYHDDYELCISFHVRIRKMKWIQQHLPESTFAALHPKLRGLLLNKDDDDCCWCCCSYSLCLKVTQTVRQDTHLGLYLLYMKILQDIFTTSSYIIIYNLQFSTICGKVWS